MEVLLVDFGGVGGVTGVTGVSSMLFMADL
jgi:hypothetical protein